MSKSFYQSELIENLPELQQHIAKLGVSSVESHVQQIPHPANGNVATAQTTLTGSNITISMPGFATPETSNTEKAHQLLNDALLASVHNALRGFETRIVTVPPQLDRQQASPARTASSGKVISPKQNQFITTLANQAKRDPDEVSKSLVGKPLSQCSAADADKIIKNLKAPSSGAGDVPW